MIAKIDKYVIEKVREKRLEKGISQSQLSFELGHKSPGYIAMIESGRYSKKYNVVQLNEIAKALDCSVKDFFPDKPL
ncbi:MAG: helix-turn-helix transcriptional regulator [Bacteroidetes bacterium]|nr:helix-turn-helix transcriptional regulator [Bacteroidota bacterium]